MAGTQRSLFTPHALPTAHKSPTATTAYTAVAARRNFDRADKNNSNGSVSSAPLSSTPQQTAVPQVRKVEWPQPVRDYVFRAFQSENLIAGISNEDMQEKLKKTLSHAAESGQLGLIDWATLPLPQQLIHQERSVMASNPWNSQAYNDNGWVSLEQPDSGSKKRKFGIDTSDNTKTPPWERDNQTNAFGDRLTYNNEKQQSKMEKRVKKQQEALGKGSSKFQAQVEKRKQRFGGNSPPWKDNSRGSSPPAPISTTPVVGTCQKLEKQYFRLNGQPKPEDVRPLDVLEKAFDFVLTKWKESGNYVYTCDQFKSIRQDLTVQRIKKDFTVKVYEFHARIALEMGDLGEYNQCQTQLRALYSIPNIKGQPAEFMAYRILYFVHTCNRIALNDILAEITPELRKQECVQHALAVRSAQASGNYHKLLAKLYQCVPGMGAFLMDMFVPRERIAAMATLCKTYKPTVSIEFLAEELGFESFETTLEFLDKAGCENAGALIRAADETNLKAWKLDMTKASPIFQTARASAFKSIDIKGQI